MLLCIEIRSTMIFHAFDVIMPETSYSKSFDEDRCQLKAHGT